MPYIPQEYRPKLDPHIVKLSEAIKEVSRALGDEKIAFPGVLNYCCTRLALEVIPDRRYYAMALLHGVFETIAQEFYRRYVAPYEDEQIKKHGDVY